MKPMVLLSPERYHLALDGLLRMNINNLFARSVVEHHVIGRVHVDDEDHPGVFLVVHPYGMSLLYGNINGDFLCGGLKAHMLDKHGRETPSEYMQVFPGKLESDIDSMLGDCLYDENRSNCDIPCPVIKYRRVNFSFSKDRFQSFVNGTNLACHSFQMVDERLFNESRGIVTAKRFWNNAGEFMKMGVGFALIHEGRAVATAFSACVHDGMLELGIETDPKYRKMGFAAGAAARLVQHCLENDLEPVWACMANNRGSLRLAVKLGFEPVTYLPCYHCLWI